MATSKLVLTFATADGEKTFNFSHAKSTGIASAVKSLMNVMITNGSIYADPPLSMKSAKIVTTNENAIDLSD